MTKTLTWTTALAALLLLTSGQSHAGCSVPASEQISWPLPLRLVYQAYGDNQGPDLFQHLGVDMAGVGGVDPVASPIDGVIVDIFGSTVPGSGRSTTVMEIWSPVDGHTYTLAHFWPFDDLARGDPVMRGEVVGLLSDEYDPSAHQNHVHMEYRDLRAGRLPRHRARPVDGNPQCFLDSAADGSLQLHRISMAKDDGASGWPEEFIVDFFDVYGEVDVNLHAQWVSLARNSVIECQDEPLEAGVQTACWILQDKDGNDLVRSTLFDFDEDTALNRRRPELDFFADMAWKDATPDPGDDPEIAYLKTYFSACNNAFLWPEIYELTNQRNINADCDQDVGAGNGREKSWVTDKKAGQTRVYPDGFYKTGGEVSVPSGVTSSLLIDSVLVNNTTPTVADGGFSATPTCDPDEGTYVKVRFDFSEPMSPSDQRVVAYPIGGFDDDAIDLGGDGTVETGEFFNSVYWDTHKPDYEGDAAYWARAYDNSSYVSDPSDPTLQGTPVTQDVEERGGSEEFTLPATLGWDSDEAGEAFNWQYCSCDCGLRGWPEGCVSQGTGLFVGVGENLVPSPLGTLCYSTTEYWDLKQEGMAITGIMISPPCNQREFDPEDEKNYIEVVYWDVTGTTDGVNVSLTASRRGGPGFGCDDVIIEAQFNGDCIEGDYMQGSCERSNWSICKRPVCPPSAQYEP